MTRTCLITGANRGLGLAFTKWAADSGYRVFASSRNNLPALSDERQARITHIPADLSCVDDAVSVITNAIGDVPLDFIIHNAGLVDSDKFAELSSRDAQAVMAINTTTPLLLTQALISNVQSGKDKKVVFIGSVSGQDNSGCDAVFYAASRMGIRGATQALRENYKKDGICFTLLEPGCMATDIDIDDGIQKAIENHAGKRLPVQDLVETVKYILSLSTIACPKHIVLTDIQYEHV